MGLAPKSLKLGTIKMTPMKNYVKFIPAIIVVHIHSNQENFKKNERKNLRSWILPCLEDAYAHKQLFYYEFFMMK